MDIKISQKDLLTRCVKCNCNKIIYLDREVAMDRLNWEYREDVPETQKFWECAECKQVYFGGGTYDRAKKRFGKFIK